MFSTGTNFVPTSRGHLTMFGDMLVVTAQGTLLAFSRSGSGTILDTLLWTETAPTTNNHLAPNDNSAAVETPCPQAAQLDFPRFLSWQVTSPQLHLLHRCTSHASLGAWPVVGSYQPGGFFLWDYIFKGSLCSCIWFLHVSDSIYSFPFCNLYCYIIFCTSFHLGVDYTLALSISLPRSTQTAHRPS